MRAAKQAVRPRKGGWLQCLSCIRNDIRSPDNIASGRGEPGALSMSERIELCGADEVEPGSAIKVETGDLSLAVFNVDGEYYVTDDLCTHGPGSLSEGYIEDDV